MNRYFLIDYENVADSGLEGFFDLTASDTVYLFYTAKACKVGIEFVDMLRKQTDGASLIFLRATTGNQALDFQLSSFLGALITEHPGPDSAFYIVSKDKGYNCLTGFWSSMRSGVRVSVIPRIAEESRRRPRTPVAAAIQPPAEETAEPAAQPETAEVPVQSEAASAALLLSPASEAVSQPTEPPVPAIAAEAPVPAEAGPDEARPEEAKDDEAPPTETAPAEAKPAEAKPAGKKALAPADRTAMNTAVQQVLSKAKYETGIISTTASLVIRMYRDGTNMQELYRGMIKSFGQKKGLEVYNLIKPVLM